MVGRFESLQRRPQQEAKANAIVAPEPSQTTGGTVFRRRAPRRATALLGAALALSPAACGGDEATPPRPTVTVRVPVPAATTETGTHTPAEITPTAAATTSTLTPSITEAPTPSRTPEGFLVQESTTTMVTAAKKILNRFQHPKLTNTNNPDYIPVNKPSTRFEIVVNDGHVRAGEGVKYEVFTITLDKETDLQSNPEDANSIHILVQKRQTQRSFDPEWYGDSVTADITMTREGDQFTISDSGKIFDNTNPKNKKAYGAAQRKLNRLLTDALS